MPRRFSSIRSLALIAMTTILVFGASVLDVSGAVNSARQLLKMEPASTWVGLARVHLEIDDLHREGDLLEGNYSIRVPLAPRQNDKGRIELNAPASVAELFGNESTVLGKAVSTTGQVHEIVARIRPNGTVRIDVTTPDRTLRFKSRFSTGGDS